ncbi:ABC transporter ATP-binding protein [Candidatus Dependentiae bacterium]|nr:ABC transporter ATP-binding protein [Candidatus Dependentiae bacterium]
MKLILKSLNKIYYSIRGKVSAINNLNLIVENNEFLVLLGPSGCGKTTLLNLIAGLEMPTSGEILFNNKLVYSKEKKIFLPTKERNISMVFQNYALYPHLSAYNNIAFPLKIMKESKEKIKHTVRKFAEILKISNILKSKPSELSGGQKQRVAIARALVREPNLFLLDEPLSNLDAKLRISTRVELKTLQKKLRITTIYVTHDQVEAAALGDRIILIKDGQVEQQGNPKELYEKPVNSFVGSFIGSPTMNIFKVQIKDRKNENFIEFDEFKITLPSKFKDKIISKNQLIGIRPEDINIEKKGGKDVLIGKILSKESFGKFELLYVSCGSKTISILTHKKINKKSNIINFSFKKDKIHFFRD